MDTYKVVISPRAMELLQKSVNYIRDVLLAPLAAQAVWEDALETVRELKTVAGSLRLCSDPRLRSLGYHAARFQRHDYIMLYRTNGILTIFADCCQSSYCVVPLIRKRKHF